MKTQEKAYIAGFFDREGHVSITHLKNTPTYQCRVGFTNTDRLILEWIKSKVGGSITLKQRVSEIHSQAFKLEIASVDEVLSLLKEIKPYVKIKTAQLNFALEFIKDKRAKKIGSKHRIHRSWDDKHASSISKQELQLRETRKIKMNELNMRGPVIAIGR